MAIIYQKNINSTFFNTIFQIYKHFYCTITLFTG